MIISFDDFIREKYQLKTKKGSVIQRYGDVGKKMGSDLYFHKLYVDDNIKDINFYNFCINQLPENFDFNIIKYNDKDRYITFINSPDFDTADEPIVSDAYKVTADGKVTLTREKRIPQIYHHKWLFVKDDYPYFNVEKSKERSRRWLEVSDRINMSKIGNQNYWEEEVLPLIESVWDVKKQEYTSSKTSVRIIPSPAKKMAKFGELKEGNINLDIGGGKYEDLTKFFAEYGVKNYVYDPYNRSREHNEIVLSKTANGQSDTVTIFNVLNVVQEFEIQLQILDQARNALKSGGKVFIYSDYFVKGKEAGPIKGRDSYQHYYKLADLLPIISRVFPNAILDSKLRCITDIKH